MAVSLILLTVILFSHLPLISVLSGLIGGVGLYLSVPVLILVWGRPGMWRPLSRGALLFWVYIFQLLNLPQRTLIQLNNRVSMLKKVPTGQIVVLAARCLQHSNCQINIVSDISQCQECGRCNIMNLKHLSMSSKLRIFVEAGGTAARTRISSLQPSLVLAVACERELIAGIADSSVPVLGLLLRCGSESCKDSTFSPQELDGCLASVLKEGTRHVPI